MCGIIGILGKEIAAPRLVASLKRMEYRGYDSAGIATITDGVIDRRRSKGKLSNLEAVLADNPLPGRSGIGHTRWATHGAPSELNAHPHITDHVAVVHNGIIENFKELRDELKAKGHNFTTETDTEVIVHMVTDHVNAGDDTRTAVGKALKRLEGAFGLAILFRGEENLMYGARRGSPLVLGYGDDEMFLGSDAIALAGLSNRIAYLEEGDWVEMTRNHATIFDGDDNEVTREIKTTNVSGDQIKKGNYRHYMQKEIHEQPTVVGETLTAYVNALTNTVALPDLPFDLEGITKVTIIACGTSYYAGLVAKYWIERMARVSVEVDVASEFRYRDPVMMDGGLSLFISQSGETADTLAALRHAKEKGQHTLAIVNVAESSMSREADAILQTHAGPEIGVASTKAFTCQLAVLATLVVALARAKGTMTHECEAEICHALEEVPSRMADVLNHDARIEAMAEQIANVRDVLYLGRGADFAIAMEGALKLKEISYIHAEGYAAGEMKHGPIALIDSNVPIIVIAPSGPLFDKTVSNMQEVIARGGRVIFISDADGIAKAGDDAQAVIEMPMVHEIVAPLLYAIPVQLLAYHVAVHKGTDVDQPRNLAKSVTVE